MSLDWNLEGIKDWESVCWLPCVDEEGKVRLNPITDTLIHLSNRIGLDEITPDNVEEWFLRLRQLEQLNLKLLVVSGEDGKLIRFNPRMEDIEQHVGLTTNAFNSKLRTRKGWDAWIAKRSREMAVQELERYKDWKQKQEMEADGNSKAVVVSNS